MLQATKNTTIYGQVIYAGEIVVKAQYLCSIEEKTNWYWKQQPLQQTIIFLTRTILHTRLDVIIIRYVKDIPKNICSRNQETNPYKDIQLLFLMLIMIKFWMKLSVVKN